MQDFNINRSSKNDRRGGFGERKLSSEGRNSKKYGCFGHKSGGNRPMFKAVCSNCGKDCQVPFRPTGNKPVYCSDCFEKMGGKDNKRPFDRLRHGSRSPSDDGYKAQLESVNAKLDKILNLLQTKDTSAVFPLVKTTIKAPIDKKEAMPTKPKKTSKEKVTTSES